MSTMKRLLLILIITLSINVYGQTDRIQFSYDVAGNQIKRFICLTCAQSRMANPDSITAEDLAAEDLEKFSPADEISYYPNPVKEQLYLRWDLIDGKKVTNIQIFSISGQEIKSFNNLSQENNITLNFQDLPVSTYLVLLIYSDGEQKSISILKQ
jgi:hypothetical protein